METGACCHHLVDFVEINSTLDIGMWIMFLSFVSSECSSFQAMRPPSPDEISLLFHIEVVLASDVGVHDVLLLFSTARL
ncbi:unnamed protein product [Caenorhabditis nigoni]